ncbi:MAG: SPFH domain-containing protein [Anaerolineales bacterium]|nr:SPFH domain-containing protein [Anaerolineales bacterium]MCB8951299.1 SPFH domain-containing protein [Ardenticatenales bacterium]
MARVFDRVAIESWLRDEIVQKFPRGGLGDIRLGSPCIVNPGETAIFVRSGESLGTLDPGTHVLTTANVPWLTDLLEKGLFGGKNVFTADVYYVKTTDMTLKWGTANPIIVEHLNRPPGASAMVGNGTYVVKVKDPWRFLNAMDAFRESVRLAQIKERLDPMLGVFMQDKMSELATAKSLGPAQLQSFSQELNNLLAGLLQTEFDAVGLTLVDFNIRLGLHPDSLSVVTKMGYGTDYTQMQIADAARAAAENPSGGNLGELGLGMMGIGAMQQQQMMQQQMRQQQPVSPPAAEPAAAVGNDMPDVMTPAQAATYLQVTEADVLAAIEAGDLKARKIGAAYRISKSSLEEFLAG